MELSSRHRKEFECNKLNSIEDALCGDPVYDFNYKLSGSSPPIDVEGEPSSFHLLTEPPHSTDDVDVDSECSLNFLSELDTVSATFSNTPTAKKRRFHKQNNNNEEEEEEEEAEETLGDEDDEMKKIKTKFKQGCDCEESNCFDHLDPRSVYRHRLNITELTKAEHDMYLMGLIKAAISCNKTTKKNHERQRLRAHYFYQGRKVCLTAFLFLENCTRYQLKRIRCHLMSHGVTPRVHGNHGKRPHNVFSLETYNQASEFLKKFFEQYSVGSGYGRTPLTISADHTTRKHIHDLYTKEFASSSSNDRLMGYTTFLCFIKHQFPHVKFVKQESSCKMMLGKEISRDKPVKQTATTSVEAAIMHHDQTEDVEANDSDDDESKVIEETYEVVLPNVVFPMSSHQQVFENQSIDEPDHIEPGHVVLGAKQDLVLPQIVRRPNPDGSHNAHPVEPNQVRVSAPHALVTDQTKAFSVPDSQTAFVMSAPSYTLTNQPLLYIQIQ